MEVGGPGRYANTGSLPVPMIQEQIVDKSVDVPKFQQFYEFDSVSVHRQRAGHFSYATETGSHSAKLCR